MAIGGRHVAGPVRAVDRYGSVHPDVLAGIEKFRLYIGIALGHSNIWLGSHNNEEDHRRHQRSAFNCLAKRCRAKGRPALLANDAVFLIALPEITKIQLNSDQCGDHQQPQECGKGQPEYHGDGHGDQELCL